MMKAIWRQEKGFTLIELLIVVAIIGILAGIAVPRISQSLESARESSCAANRKAIETAAELYRINNNKYPALDDLVGPGREFREKPECGSEGSYEIDPATGEVYCSVHNRKPTGS